MSYVRSGTAIGSLFNWVSGSVFKKTKMASKRGKKKNLHPLTTCWVLWRESWHSVYSLLLWCLLTASLVFTHCFFGVYSLPVLLWRIYPVFWFVDPDLNLHGSALVWMSWIREHANRQKLRNKPGFLPFLFKKAFVPSKVCFLLLPTSSIFFM